VAPPAADERLPMPRQEPLPPAEKAPAPPKQDPPAAQEQADRPAPPRGRVVTISLLPPWMLKSSPTIRIAYKP
jgi:hypothetical protein